MAMAAETFYRPTPRGAEARIGERLAEWARRRAARRSERPDSSRLREGRVGSCTSDARCAPPRPSAAEGFTRFVGIDWSGAVGSRHPSVQVAVCEAGADAPRLVLPPSGVWSRSAVLDWLGSLSGDVLVGMDAGFGFAAVPPFTGPARDLWAEIDAVAAADADLGGHSFIAHRRDTFWLGAADGPRHLRAHLRVTEQVYAASKLGVPTSNFVLLGASQVGKATLSAMRLLHRLRLAGVAVRSAARRTAR